MSVASFPLGDFDDEINITYIMYKKMHTMSAHGKTIAQEMPYDREYQEKSIEDRRR